MPCVLAKEPFRCTNAAGGYGRTDLLLAFQVFDAIPQLCILLLQGQHLMFSFPAGCCCSLCCCFGILRDLLHSVNTGGQQPDGVHTAAALPAGFKACVSRCCMLSDIQCMSILDFHAFDSRTSRAQQKLWLPK